VADGGWTEGMTWVLRCVGDVVTDVAGKTRGGM
jgi:hypothetical protein